MDDTKDPAVQRHPIGVVSARTGLPQDLIRAWERRYTAVDPTRSQTGRRLYSDDDIERLRLLRRAVAGGRRISDVAALPIDRLRAVVDEDRAENAAGTSPARGTVAASALALRDEAMAALEAFDKNRLERVLTDASVELSGPALRQQLIVPLLDLIGERWQDGTLRIMHEHLASTIVRSFMNTMRAHPPRPHAPRLVVTTPAGQYHELGALMAAAVADEIGWDVYYLGPNLPAEEVAAASRQLNARAVALSVIYRNGDAHAVDEIRRVRQLIDPAIPVFVGGRATPAIQSRLAEAGVVYPADLNDFRLQLESVTR